MRESWLVIELVSVSAALVEEAARLLSRTVRAPQATGCFATVSDLVNARKCIEAALPAPSVAAMDDSRLVGYLVAQPPRPPGQVVEIKAGLHATTVQDRREIYRRLYAHLAGELTKIGGFSHRITVSCDDRETVASWFELGFGVDQIKGVQPIRLPVRVKAAETDLRVREARPVDLDPLVDLSVELTHYHAESPMLRPALTDHDFVRDGLIAGIDAARSLVAVAEVDGTIDGFFQLDPDHHFRDTATIGLAFVRKQARHGGVGTALLDFAMEWARDHGYRYCTVGWTSPNLVSDQFWRSRGFQPLQYKLTRRIDSRVAWADSKLRYDYVRPLDL